MLLKKRRNQASAAFSLLEMSIVVAILSVVAIMGLQMVAIYFSRTAYLATQERMAAIDAALVKYRYVHGRLPCPAALAVAITANTYGKENCAGAATLTSGATSVQVNAGGSGYPAAGFVLQIIRQDNNGVSLNANGAVAKANVDSSGEITSIVMTNPGYGYASTDNITVDWATYYVNGGSGTDGAASVNKSSIRFGALPVRELNLPPSYALDAYGSKFLYYVTDNLSNSATFNTNDTFKNSTGVIPVRSGKLRESCSNDCQTIVTNAAYAIVSVGGDQRGGYNQRGKLINNCIPEAGYASAIDAQNCLAIGPTDTAIGVTIPKGVIYNSTFSNGTASATYFDDLVLSRLKSEL